MTHPARRLAAPALVLVFLLGACAHGPSPKDRELAQIRYDLGVQATQEGKIQAAVKELRKALEKNPDFPEAHNALGLLYHVSLGRKDKAEAAYLEALALRPDFSEAANNLGALYLDTERAAEAEPLFRKALDDVLYPTPHLARGNLGWALHLQGRHEEALVELKQAVLLQPRFCVGHRNLGRVLRGLDREDEAAGAFRAYVESCPEQAEAQYEWGLLRLAAGDTDGALEAFARCYRQGTGRDLAGECLRNVEALGGDPADLVSPSESEAAGASEHGGAQG